MREPQGFPGGFPFRGLYSNVPALVPMCRQVRFFLVASRASHRPPRHTTALSATSAQVRFEFPSQSDTGMLCNNWVVSVLQCASFSVRWGAAFLVAALQELGGVHVWNAAPDALLPGTPCRQWGVTTPRTSRPATQARLVCQDTGARLHRPPQVTWPSALLRTQALE